MNVKFDKIMLIAISFTFIFVGAAIVFFTFDRIKNSNICIFKDTKYSIGQTIEGYKKNSTCVCESGSIVCSKVADLPSVPQINQFVRTNLKVTPTYLSVGGKEPLDSLPLKTMFTSVSKVNGNLKITIEQEQKCTTDLRIPVQIGMYFLNNDNVYITNIVNKDKKFQNDCIVSVNYIISKIKNIQNNLQISYIGEDGTEIKANICNYESKIYVNNDVYSSKDNCNICTCTNGVSKCSNDRVCTTK